MSGKCASVPNCRQGFQFDGQGIKQLSGAGSLYVRLTRDLLKNEVQVIDVTSDSFHPCLHLLSRTVVLDM